jgi:hypothetical protein
MKSIRLKSRSKNEVLSQVVISRSEMTRRERDAEFQTWKELNQWLLWAGISPESGMPVSSIGIYTDFT